MILDEALSTLEGPLFSKYIQSFVKQTLVTKLVLDASPALQMNQEELLKEEYDNTSTTSTNHKRP